MRRRVRPAGARTVRRRRLRAGIRTAGARTVRRRRPRAAAGVRRGPRAAAARIRWRPWAAAAAARRLPSAWRLPGAARAGRLPAGGLPHELPRAASARLHGIVPHRARRRRRPWREAQGRRHVRRRQARPQVEVKNRIATRPSV
ncbi:hypothetical protein BRADI_2g00381v3 [Brachypodium distachyon]|uniref:Uncharacterized protein n=1 Tax=Brachypodium distachyon TaxID=15368 RepID=A0A0Q3FT03_BRADI|nr:hypothetical protein BRADI_2g00381v3 [Brachypodium distachyon]